MKPLRAPSFFLAMFCCAVAWAQTVPTQPPKAATQKQDEPTIRIATELVQIEVIVTDNAGKPVRDLKREDFELKEDGKLQDVSYFSAGTPTQPARWITSEPKAKSIAPIPITTAPEIRAGNYIVLLVDDLHLSPESLVRARQALLKFVEQFTNNEQVALITTSGQLWVYQQFTSNREILKRAINRLTVMERRVLSVSGDVPRLTPYQAELIQNRDSDALALAVNEILRKMPDISPDLAAAMAQAKAQQIVSENTFNTKATLSTLEEIMRSLRALQGRKLLVLLSDGFLLGRSNQASFYDLRQITDAAMRSGIRIYSLDTRGLVTGTFDASQPGFGNEQPPGARQRIESSAVEANRDGLNAVARDTGGFPVFNQNDLYFGLQKIIEDTEVYYLIAFEPVSSYRDGRFRKLEVSIKDHPEYKIRSSRGYFAPNDKEAAKKGSPMKMGLSRNTFSSLVPAREIPMTMAVDFVDTGKGEGYATITAHLDISGVKFEKVNERYNATMNVMGAIYDEEGKALDRFNRKLALALKPATYERMLKSGFVFDSLVKLRPGFYQVRLSATKENSQLAGSVSEWVEIADLSKKDLVLSSVFLASEKETLSALSSPTEKLEEEKKIEDQQAVAMPSQISRRFKRGSQFDYTILAYNPKSNPNGEIDLAVQTQIFSGSKVVFASPLSKMRVPPEKKDALFVPYAGRVTLDGFEPGNYELRLLVIDRITKTSAKRSLNFVVEP